MLKTPSAQITLQLLAVVCAVVVTFLAVERRLRSGRSGQVDPWKDGLTQVENWPTMQQSGLRIGSDSAGVTVVEFADFECPACRVFATQTLLPYLDANPGRIALVFQHWPLPYHRFARLAGVAAECAAASGAFEQFYRTAFDWQDSLGLVSFARIAAAAGIDDTFAFNNCRAKPVHLDALSKGEALALGVAGRGTPTIVINGHRLPTTPDLKKFTQLVDSFARTAPVSAR
jgi:protein-disulfide isomerase